MTQAGVARLGKGPWFCHFLFGSLGAPRRTVPPAPKAPPRPDRGAGTARRADGDDGVSGDWAGGSAGVVGTDSQGRMDLSSRPCTPEWLTGG